MEAKILKPNLSSTQITTAQQQRNIILDKILISTAKNVKGESSGKSGGIGSRLFSGLTEAIKKSQGALMKTATPKEGMLATNAGSPKHVGGGGTTEKAGGKNKFMNNAVNKIK